MGISKLLQYIQYCGERVLILQDRIVITDKHTYYLDIEGCWNRK
jgi:hypothetical protein